MPACCNSIVVRPSYHKHTGWNSNSSGMATILHILAKSIDNITKELSWKCIIMYGKPLDEFMGLMCNYECHYVFPHNCCDEIADLQSFYSLNVFHHSTIQE